jgi:hypothetical protein
VRIDRRLIGLAATLATLAPSGCARREAAPPPPPALETVDVAAQPDAHASLEADVVERRAAPPQGIAGVLPEGFPREVPVPSPSSVIDFGAGAHGGRAVTFELPRGVRDAEADYRARLRRAGFESDDGGVWRRGGLAVRFEVVPVHGASRLTVEILG